MKTQSSLEVPKQVRSASFDEIQLEAKRNQQMTEDKDFGPGGGVSGFLKVPEFLNQRSKSFDSGGSEDSTMYLEVPRRFQRRRSSSDKMPATCFHCSCVEEFSRLRAVARADELAQDHQSQTRSSSYSDTSSSDWDDDDEMVSKDGSFEVNNPNTQCSIRVTLSPISPGSASLECPPPGEEGVPGSPATRRRSITSPKLARQEAFFVVEPGTNSLENISDVTSEGSGVVSGGSVGSCVEGGVGLIVSDFYLKVPELKRDRAASVDSCFTKVSSNNKTEELDQVLTLQVPQVALRSRSVDIVLPTDEQARYKALAMANTSPYGPAVKGYVTDVCYDCQIVNSVWVNKWYVFRFIVHDFFLVSFTPYGLLHLLGYVDEQGLENTITRSPDRIWKFAVVVYINGFCFEISTFFF